MPALVSKVTPAQQKHTKEKTHRETNDRRENKGKDTAPFKMLVVSLHTLLKRYGGQRHPKIEQYKDFSKREELILWKYIPPGSKMIYLSHQWAGTHHPDPSGDQFYHLFLLLERLQSS